MLRFQDEVAQRVVDGLKVQGSPSEHAMLAAPITANVEAYNYEASLSVARAAWERYRQQFA